MSLIFFGIHLLAKAYFQESTEYVEGMGCNGYLLSDVCYAGYWRLSDASDDVQTFMIFAVLSFFALTLSLLIGLIFLVLIILDQIKNKNNLP